MLFPFLNTVGKIFVVIFFRTVQSFYSKCVLCENMSWWCCYKGRTHCIPRLQHCTQRAPAITSSTNERTWLGAVVITRERERERERVCVSDLHLVRSRSPSIISWVWKALPTLLQSLLYPRSAPGEKHVSFHHFMSLESPTHTTPILALPPVRSRSPSISSWVWKALFTLYSNPCFTNGLPMPPLDPGSTHAGALCGLGFQSIPDLGCPINNSVGFSSNISKLKFSLLAFSPPGSWLVRDQVCFSVSHWLHNQNKWNET